MTAAEAAARPHSIRCAACKGRHDSAEQVLWCHTQPDEGPCCSICDGAGHGYPGGPPCPLEIDEVARWETDLDELRALPF